MNADRLRLKRATATAGLNCVRVLESEALLFDTVVPINRCAVQVERTLLVDDDGNAMMLVSRICSLIEFVVERKRVVEAAASAACYADAEKHFVSELVLFTKLLDLIGRIFAENHCHRGYPYSKNSADTI